jgi:hypothetical protein
MIISCQIHLTGLTKASLEVNLIEEEQRNGRLTGVTSWLATGLKIEENQSVKLKNYTGLG